jgi:hypothetical protein
MPDDARFRARAGLHVYAGRSTSPAQRHRRARHVLAEIRRRFVRAELSAHGQLRVQYLVSASADQAIGYALLWHKVAPRRELCIRVRPSLGVVYWELTSPELGQSRTGGPSLPEFTPELLESLIDALLDQESWERRIVPSVPGAAEDASTKVEERVRGKVLEVRERIHAAFEAVPRNVAGGLRSTVKQRLRQSARRRDPPSGRPPAVVRAEKREDS